MTGSLDEIKDFVGSDSAQTSNMSSTDKSLPTVSDSLNMSSTDKSLPTVISDSFNMSSTDKSLPTVISVPTVKSVNNMMSGKLTVDEDREIGDVNSGEFFIHFHI